MKFHSFKHFFKDAFNNTIRNRLMSLATIITLASGIFLLGLTLIITFNVFAVTEKLQKDFKIAVYLDENINTAKINEIGLKIKDIPNVLGIEFVSKEKAFEDFKEQYGETEILEGINDGSVLRNSYKITLSDLKFSREVSESLRKIDGIVKVTEFDDYMERLISVSKKLQIGTITISLILCLLSILIITNTINMSIFSRRKQINIMKYVGATDWYIRWPFIIEGFIIGIISALLSFLGVYMLYDILIKATGTSGEMIGFLTKEQAMPFVFAIIVFVGIILGCLGSFFSVKKHLKV